MGRRRLFPWKQPRSDSLVVCDVDPALTEKLRKFRFRKETNNAAILMKIDKERQLVVLEEEFQVFEIRTTEDLTEEWLLERLAFFR
uniref:Glia maturation factor gamma n=1 Tax=Chelonoidis abingdonii TaxID=106734 RepID=A0A8C0GQ34_CHEAB